jgi:hypothetical protein
MRRRKIISIFCDKMVKKIVEKMLFSLSVSVALAEYSVSAKYLAEYTAEIFGRSHFRSDTSVYTFEQQQIKDYLAGHLWQQIVHRIVRQFVCKIDRVDGP